MPSGGERAIRREPLIRAAVRRQIIATFRLAEALSRYAAASIADGMSPEQSRQATTETAAELADLAALLARLARLDLAPEQRRALARRLAADGLTVREIAVQVGRSPRQVRDYLRGRS